MNILFLHRIWPSYGGGETVTKCLANELTERGYNIHILYLKKSIKKNEDSDVNSKITQTLIPNVSFNETSKEFFVNKKEAKYVSKFTIEYILKNKIDFIINQWWPIEFLNNVRNQTNAKIIKCLHMDPDTKRVFHFNGAFGLLFKIILPSYRYIERKKHIYSLDKYINHSDLLIFLSPSFLNFYRLQKGNKKNIVLKTDFVYNPLVYNIDNPINIRQKENIVLFVGRLLEKHKQLSRILYAWKKIEIQNDHNNWKLIIVGDGPSKELYQQLSQKLGLKKIEFTGYQNPLQYYQKASIFVMSSAYEGFPMTLVESLQNSVVPIVMDTYSSLHDIITNNVNGIIVPNGNIKAFSDAIYSLIINNKKREQMATLGYDSCKKYHIKTIVDKWEDIFHKIK